MSGEKEDWNFSPFPNLLAAAIEFDALANRELQANGKTLIGNRFAKASILEAAMSVECAAHCLILRMPSMSHHLLDQLQNWKTLDKFDFAYWAAHRKPLDRGAASVQKIAELVKLRNDIVHAKVTKESVEMTQKDGDRAMQRDRQEYPMLRMLRDSSEWFGSDSRSVVKDVLTFYNAYLLSLGQTKDALSCWLCTSVGSAAFLRSDDKAQLKTVKDVYGVDVAFINL